MTIKLQLQNMFKTLLDTQNFIRKMRSALTLMAVTSVAARQLDFPLSTIPKVRSITRAVNG
jgi:hypothetical protein